ncbi:tripartite tricarboxylate transporter TctB family protein [Phyllobacterium sp. LjRoot231]|uniref:tripartite tricarboxylate transporter TctB family protein n=1 Tax=Phyllobacterium sp. LjRoot231 TaxID=3342289 RepID=UPI003ECF7B7F
MKLSFSTWLTFVMLAIFGTMVAMATQFPPNARFMPFVVGIPGIGLCLLQLGMDLLRAPGSQLAESFQPASKAGVPANLVPEEEPEFGPHTVSRELTMWAYFVGFIAAVLVFGFYVSVPVMLLMFLRREAEASWKFALFLAAAATLVLYLMFGLVLHVQLHHGFVTPVILRSFGFEIS